ncbi:MAG: hypothetical protein AAGF01_03890 [Cyanobacteria bacterium P01_G01_bin.38]
MTQNGPNGLQINFSGIGCWLTLIGLAWLIGAVGLGWVVKSALVLFGLIAIAPVIAFIGFRFWLKQRLVQGNCPVCSQPLAGLTTMQTACPNCGTALKATREGFQRATPEGTIEVQAVEVETQAADVNVTEVQTLDVEVRQLPDGDVS